MYFEQRLLSRHEKRGWNAIELVKILLVRSGFFRRFFSRTDLYASPHLAFILKQSDCHEFDKWYEIRVAWQNTFQFFHETYSISIFHNQNFWGSKFCKVWNRFNLILIIFIKTSVSCYRITSHYEVIVIQNKLNFVWVYLANTRYRPVTSLSVFEAMFQKILYSILGSLKSVFVLEKESTRIKQKRDYAYIDTLAWHVNACWCWLHSKWTCLLVAMCLKNYV